MINFENEVIPNHYESVLFNQFSKKELNERCQSVFVVDEKKKNEKEINNHYSMHKNIIINYWEKKMSLNNSQTSMEASCIASKIQNKKRNNVFEKGMDCQSGCQIF